jgi:putative YpdA family bacillithiol system oxidoreductase
VSPCGTLLAYPVPVTWVVPLTLVGTAVLLMAVFTMLGARKHRYSLAGRLPTAAPGPRILVHDINDDRCTGCDACVAVCPTNVLDLVDNKSRVLHFQDCIQCEACMFACPTEALVMFPEGGTPPALQVPALDEHFQTAVPGQYLIGEVAGKPLVKNAANLGRAVVEHMLHGGLRPGALGRGAGAVDVAIVGSGPGGLSAALTCMQRGLSYVVLEKEQLISSTIARYPKGKLVMAEPYESLNLSLLPVFDSSKEQILPIWKELIQRTGLEVKLGEAVEGVAKARDGTFDIRTTVASYRAQRVVLATGTRGKPRTLQVPGENLPKVASLLDDPDEHRGLSVLVVGGGDSAVEAALALADAGAKVTVSYRGRAFNRAQPKNKQAIEAYAAEGRVKIKFQSQVVQFEPEAVILQLGDGTQKRYPNQAAFVLIGADPPIKWLEKLGIHFVERPHQYALGRTDELVRRFVPVAGPCPEDAASAAALVGGQIDEAQRAASVVALPEPPQPVSGPRKWLRSATGLFTGARKLDQPMPLSEFARKQRFKSAHTGHGRRDALTPGERTRVLRMLRDEGARLADEDSRVDLYPAPPIHRGPPGPPSAELSPPPEPRLERTGMPMPPLHLDDDDLPPKQAVIVGLAKAMAGGPTAGRSKRPSAPPPMPPPVPGATPPGVTRPGVAADLRERPPARMQAPPPGMARMQAPPPGMARAKRPSPAPPVRRRPVPPAFGEEPTRRLDAQSELAAMLRAAKQDGRPPVRRGPSFDDEMTRSRHDDEATRAVDVDAAGLTAAAHDTYEGHDTHDELIDVGYLSGAHGAIDLGPRDESSRFDRVDVHEDATAIADVEKIAALERARTRAAATAAGRSAFDEPTRTVDAVRPKTLSDIDWDID